MSSRIRAYNPTFLIGLCRSHMICWENFALNSILLNVSDTNAKSIYHIIIFESHGLLYVILWLRQYDPLIIETTIGLVLGPCTALCRLFLKHCTLTNKAVGTIWRALSKPPQRRQGPDLRPLWLLVGTPSAIRPELAFSRAEHSLPYSDVTIYIFAILYLSSMPYV